MNNYKIHEIHDLSNQQVFEILKSGITREMFANDAISKNYLYEYCNDPANLFYILTAGRYKNGSYFVVTDLDNNYLASAGWNYYDDDTALLLTRMLVIPKYRGSYILAKTVLKQMIDQSSNYKKQWITFNEYNLTLYKWFERVEQGKRGALFNNWPDIYSRFRPIGQHNVNHVLQYVVELKNK
jgi:hypothetical protein